MKRRLSNPVAAVSLLMCLATIGLWARSCWCEDFIRFSGRRWGLFTTPHTLWSSYSSTPALSTTPWYSTRPAQEQFGRAFGPFWGFTRRPAPGGASYAAIGFVYVSYVQPGGHPYRFTSVAIPFWLIVAATALPPLHWLKRRRWQVIPGLCPTCGYDVRATPNRCPECGSLRPAEVPTRP